MIYSVRFERSRIWSSKLHVLCASDARSVISTELARQPVVPVIPICRPSFLMEYLRGCVGEAIRTPLALSH